MLRAVNEQPASPYDNRAYQRITDAVFRDGKLRITFGNGDAGAIDPALLERGIGTVDWDSFSWNEYELVVTAAEVGSTSIPWIDLRREQDPAFASYLAELDSEHALAVATHVRQLREQQGLSVAGLAEAAGLDPERVDRIEQGGDYTLADLGALCEPLQVPIINLLVIGGSR